MLMPEKRLTMGKICGLGTMAVIGWAVMAGIVGAALLLIG